MKIAKPNVNIRVWFFFFLTIGLRVELLFMMKQLLRYNVNATIGNN